MKILLLNVLLVAFAVVHAQDDAQAPPLPPGVADPVEPPLPPGVADPVLPPLPPGVADPVVPPLPPGVAVPVEPPLPPGVADPVLPPLPPGVAVPVVPPLPPRVAVPVEPPLPPGVADPVVPPLPPGVADPVVPPPMSCKEQCALKCSKKHGFRRTLCMGKCKVLCKIISPSDHAGYQCIRDCVINNLNHQPGIKNIDDLVNTCQQNCSKNV